MSEEEIHFLMLRVLELIARNASASCRDEIMVCDIERAIAELT